MSTPNVNPNPPAPPPAPDAQNVTDTVTSTSTAPVEAAATPTPAPAASPATPTPAEEVAKVVAEAKQDITDAQQAFFAISATARERFHQLLADVEQAEKVSLDSIRRALGV